MAKTDNLTDLLTDVADAIRAKKGTTDKINPQDFADEIASIEGGGGGDSMMPSQRVSYIRRTNTGYIDTGVEGANSKLRIKVRYSMRIFPSSYWMFIGAYKDENTNSTRILFNGKQYVLASLNSKAASSISISRSPQTTGIIYTDEIYPSGTGNYVLSANGTTSTKARTAGNTLTGNIRIFAAGTDTVDIDLYDCQIYDDDTLVRNFIPDYQNGKFGLYDTVTKKFYGSVNEGEFSGEKIEFDSTDDTNATPLPTWTGHADAEGLRAIGWDEEDIAYFQQYGVNWNEEDDDVHKVSDANKTVYGLLTEKNLSTYKADIVYLPKIDTSTRTSFANYFANMYWLEGVPYLDTSNATSVSGMYSGCSALRAVPPMNLSKATTTSKLFTGCLLLRYIPPMDTPKVTDTSSMFQNCSQLEEVPLFDTQLVKSMASMFSGCVLLRDIPEYSTNNVTSMASMLYNCRSISKVPYFNTQNVTNMSNMFYGCYRLKEIPKFDTQKVTTTANMFQACINLVSVPQLNLQSVTTASSMFYNCYKLRDVPDLNTHSMTVMTSMFNGCCSLKEVPQLNTQNTTMFNNYLLGCTNIREVPPIDTSKATTMEAMFSGCNQLMYIPDLDISNTTTTKNMFNSCFSLQRAPKVDTSNATNIDAMYTTATSLVVIPEIDMQNVTSVSSAPFNKCYALREVKAKNIKVSTTFANCYFLSKESLLYMIQNEAATGAITITLNSKVYTSLAEDEDIVAALAEHPNISLASA